MGSFDYKTDLCSFLRQHAQFVYGRIIYKLYVLVIINITGNTLNLFIPFSGRAVIFFFFK